MASRCQCPHSSLLLSHLLCAQGHNRRAKGLLARATPRHPAAHDGRQATGPGPRQSAAVGRTGHHEETSLASRRRRDTQPGKPPARVPCNQILLLRTPTAQRAQSDTRQQRNRCPTYVCGWCRRMCHLSPSYMVSCAGKLRLTTLPGMICGHRSMISLAWQTTSKQMKP